MRVWLNQQFELFNFKPFKLFRWVQLSTIWIIQMGEQLQLDLKSPGSPFQMFLKYSPDALNHLFNRWKFYRNTNTISPPIRIQNK